MHKVWILDCKSCRTFLTNRGMKAVLLLRPDVSLFSTDALPANCSAFSTCRSPNAPARAKPRHHEPPRTCECLTQTLCCHGCGSPVGYMIVVPCTRCSSSVCLSPPLPAAFIHAPVQQHTSRSANGHRFVFHASEVLAEERLYVSGEPGVIPDFDPAPPPPPWHSNNFTFNTPHSPTLVYTAHIPFTTFAPRSPLWGHHANSSVDHTMNRTFNLPTPPTDIVHSTSTAQPRPQTHRDPYPFDNTPSLPPTYSPADTEYFPIPHGPPLASYYFPRPPQVDWAEPASEPVPAYRKPMLQPGDPVCWYHLARHGELPCVEDDPRARSGSSSTSDKQTHSGSANTDSHSDTRPANIWCAR